MADVVEKTKEELEAEQLQKDVEGFNAELIPLLGKFNVGLGATAFVTPDGRIGARPIMFRPAPTENAAQPAPAPTAPAAAPAVTGSEE